MLSITSQPPLSQGNDPGIHWIAGWVGSIVGLDAVEKRKISFPCQELNPYSPVIQSVACALCQLSYSGPNNTY